MIPRSKDYLLLFWITIVVYLSEGDARSPRNGRRRDRRTRTWDVTVSTKYGRIMGSRRTEDYDIGPGALTQTVDVFLGVPYAQPPIGQGRFQPPSKLKSWGNDVFDARKPGPACPQVPYYSQTSQSKQSEDCLKLNIYSPVIVGSEQNFYPVMIFIHGGSYEEGSGNRYDGFTLAQHGVVVVTINYRLGALGYLTTGGGNMPGNYGLLDQIEAVRWVSNNIASFRGDKNWVTVLGSSAGSASAGFLMLSPYTEGLIHRAILQSGSPLAFWAHYNRTVDLRHFTLDVATKVGCGHAISDDVMKKCLQRVPYQKFIDIHGQYLPIVPSQLNFKPIIDGKIIPDDPKRLFTAHEYNKMPVMIGVLEDEWARSMGWFFRELNESMIDENFTDGFERQSFVKSIHHVVTKRFNWPPPVADVVIQEYTYWDNVSNPYSNRKSYVEFMSDLTMIIPSIELAHLITEPQRPSEVLPPVYFYNYQHTSHLTEPSWWGSYHSLELDAVFGSPFNGYDIATDRNQVFLEKDREISRKMMKWWTNFAKYGSPNDPLESTHLWQPFRPDASNVLCIKYNQHGMVEHFRTRQSALWTNLVPRVLHDFAEASVHSQQQNNGVDLPKCASDNLYTTLCWIFIVTSAFSFLAFIATLSKYSGMKTRLTAATRLLNENPCTAV